MKGIEKIENKEGFCFISRDKRLLNVCMCDNDCKWCRKIEVDFNNFVSEISDEEIKYAVYDSRQKTDKRKRRRFI